MQADFLIVGQGLAGSLLARSLRARHLSVQVIDDGWRSSASQVAAGLMTPLTGRRFTLTPEYPELFKFAKKELSALGVFHEIKVYRMFVDEEQRSRGLKRAACDTCAPFIDKITTLKGEINDFLDDQLGGVLMSGAWVDLPQLLKQERENLKTNKSLIEETFNPEELTETSTGVIWKNIQARGIIYCDGYKSAQRGPFTYLPWQPAKGEALTFKSDSPQTAFVLNREGWALPQANGVWRTGTNWEWTHLNEEVSQPQQDKLIKRFKSYFNHPVSAEEVTQVAGVRPCTSDNHPFLGTHPQHRSIHLCNGFGPRGTVWAPTAVQMMTEYLVDQKSLRPDCDIARFPAV